MVYTMFGVQKSMEGLLKALNNDCYYSYFHIHHETLDNNTYNRSGHNDHEENSAKHQ